MPKNVLTGRAECGKMKYSIRNTLASLKQLQLHISTKFSICSNEDYDPIL